MRACLVCGADRDAKHREAVRRAKLIVRIAKGAGLTEGLREVVREVLETP